MKFTDYEVYKDKYGFSYIKNDIIKGDEGKCLQCGNKTSFIEVCSESHFCSDECVKEWYEQYYKILNEKL